MTRLDGRFDRLLLANATAWAWARRVQEAVIYHPISKTGAAINVRRARAMLAAPLIASLASGTADDATRCRHMVGVS